MDLMIHERRDEADGVVSLTLGRPTAASSRPGRPARTST